MTDHPDLAAFGAATVESATIGTGNPRYGLLRAIGPFLTDPANGLFALMALALIVGAGGVSAAFGNLAVQLVALALLALHARGAARFARSGPRVLAVLMVLTCLLPLLQLVPLPPALWERMPGRELVAQSLDLAGGRGWYPLSFDRGRTLVAFLGTLAPATVIVLASGFDPARLVRLQRLVIVLGTAIGLFGAIHLFRPEWADFYAADRPMPGILVGTFADRNGAALFFVGCLLLLAGLPDLPRTPLALLGRVAAGLVLAACTVLTQSRTGLVLLAAPLALVGAAALAPWLRRGGGMLRSAAVIGGALLLAAAAVGALLASGQGRVTLDRFDGDDGMRAEMRDDALFVARRYWPAGAGMGTFAEVFQVDESLEYVSPRTAGRAHMDYLELTIEAGLAGVLLLVGWAGWVLATGWRAWRRSGAWPARAGGLVLVTIAAQSLLSFPLRSQAMLCFAAFAVVLLARSPAMAPRENPRETGR